MENSFRVRLRSNRNGVAAFEKYFQREKIVIPTGDVSEEEELVEENEQNEDELGVAIDELESQEQHDVEEVEDTFLEDTAEDIEHTFRWRKLKVPRTNLEFVEQMTIPEEI